MSSAHLDGVVALTRELVEIDSVSGDEAAIAGFIETRLGQISPHVLLRAGNSLCCVPRVPDPDLPTLMLAGHTDTVPALEPNTLRVEGDRLYGLGAADMKAADAVILDVLARAASSPPKVNLIGVLYACEEVSFERNELPQLRSAARQWFDATDLAVCMEPTDGRLEVGCLGTAHATVTFEGRRAHSARPWQGDNAIHHASGLLARLAAGTPTEHEFGGVTFVESLSANSIDYRGARNIVPDRCMVNVNHRFAPGKDEEQVRADLEALVCGEAAIEVIDFCPSGEVCVDHPLLTSLHEAAGGLEVCAKQAWTDVGRLSSWGIDAVNWGPGATAQAHQAGEWVSLAAVSRCLEVLERWLWS